MIDFTVFYTQVILAEPSISRLFGDKFKTNKKGWYFTSLFGFSKANLTYQDNGFLSVL